jgi:hypothetical protein
VKLMIAALVATTLAIAAAVTGFAFDQQAGPTEPACADSCDVAAHKASAQHNASIEHGMQTTGMVADAMPGMPAGGMSGMSGTPAPTAFSASTASTASMADMQIGRAHV